MINSVHFSDDAKWRKCTYTVLQNEKYLCTWRLMILCPPSAMKYGGCTALSIGLPNWNLLLTEKIVKEILPDVMDANVSALKFLSHANAQVNNVRRRF